MGGFGDKCDSIGVHAVVVTWLSPYRLWIKASSSIPVCLSSRKSNVSGTHEESFSAYVDMKNFHFETYATEDVINCTDKYVES